MELIFFVFNLKSIELHLIMVHKIKMLNVGVKKKTFNKSMKVLCRYVVFCLINSKKINLKKSIKINVSKDKNTHMLKVMLCLF